MPEAASTAPGTAAPETAEAAPPPVPEALKRFLWDIQSMVELADSDREILLVGRDLMSRLIAADDWLPATFAAAAPGACRQYRLYRDDMERFCVVATVLGGGASLPVTEHATWEITGLLRGVAGRQRFALAAGALAQDEGRPLARGEVLTCRADKAAGTRLFNAAADADAILIHVFGGDIGTLARRTIAADGSVGEAATSFANPPESPAYDILTIQTRIVD